MHGNKNKKKRTEQEMATKYKSGKPMSKLDWKIRATKS